MSSHEYENTDKLRENGFHVSESITIDCPVEDVYHFWRNFEQLPMFMSHLQSVETLPDGRSLWRAKMPGDLPVEWVARVVNDVPNEAIAWESTEDSMMPNAGSVHFTPSADHHSTEVHVEMDYIPPGGGVGELIAEFLVSDPKMNIKRDLRRLKEILEMELSDDTKPSWTTQAKTDMNME